MRGLNVPAAHAVHSAEPLVEKYPELHGMQPSELCPVDGLYRPAAHGVHCAASVSDTLSDQRPAGHGDGTPATQKEPDGQGLHAPSERSPFCCAAVPSGQASHVSLPAASGSADCTSTVPAAHEHDDAPGGAVALFGHGVHAIDADVLAKELRGHCSHVVMFGAPTAVEKRPGLHAVHAVCDVCPSRALYVPLRHRAQPYAVPNNADQEPRGQRVHDAAAPSKENVPGEQVLQTALDVPEPFTAVEYVPAGQRVQTDAPARLYVPVGQAR